MYVAAVHRGEETTSGLAALNGRRWLAAEFAADEIAQALGPAAATATADLIGS